MKPTSNWVRFLFKMGSSPQTCHWVCFRATVHTQKKLITELTKTRHTHTHPPVRTHCVFCTTGSWRLTLPCCWPEFTHSSSSNKALNMHGYSTDPKACEPFGKCAFKNKQGCAKSPWHADNGFTASCRSRVREQTTSSLSGAGRGGEGEGQATRGVSKGSSVAVDMERKNWQEGWGRCFFLWLAHVVWTHANTIFNTGLFHVKMV